ncbi:MAG: transposon-transfer assisting family protein [Anaerostipes sp.]|nr:transposon-transfer assisting family protein [Anaerostipes sp.]MDD3746284.1 transposon-transfer assisting family protein [Anaerostipes sp.]
MSITRFEENECLVITMFQEENREKAIQTIKEAKKHMDENDEELMDLMNQTIRKMKQISDEAYRKFDFDSYKAELEDEDNED